MLEIFNLDWAASVTQVSCNNVHSPFLSIFHFTIPFHIPVQQLESPIWTLVWGSPETAMNTKQNLNRAWLLPALICFHVDLSPKLLLLLHTQHCSTQKSIRQDHSQDKSNLVARIWWSAGVPGDKASWLVEDWGWAIKAGTRATQSTLPAGPTSTVTVLYVDSVPSQKDCLDFFWT